MSRFEKFGDHYGGPEAGTGSDSVPAMADSAVLTEFHEETGGGVFASGLISILSRRELLPSLGGWERWLPPGAKLFATSAMGMLFLTSGEDLWIVDTQYGEVIESTVPIVDLINSFADLPMREEYLYESRVKAWLEVSGALDVDCVLSPTPALALGGTLEVTSLRPVKLEVYLGFTSQLFGNEGDLAVQIHKLG